MVIIEGMEVGADPAQDMSGGPLLAGPLQLQKKGPNLQWKFKFGVPLLGQRGSVPKFFRLRIKSDLLYPQLTYLNGSKIN